MSLLELGSQHVGTFCAIPDLGSQCVYGAGGFDAIAKLSSQCLGTLDVIAELGS